MWTFTNMINFFYCYFINPYGAKGLGHWLYATLHKMPGEVDYSFCLFLKSKTLSFTHLEATSYIPQQDQSLHFWTTYLFTTGCYKIKYTLQFLWMACINRFAMAILNGETELALGTIRVKPAGETANKVLVSVVWNWLLVEINLSQIRTLDIKRKKVCVVCSYLYFIWTWIQPVKDEKRWSFWMKIIYSKSNNFTVPRNSWISASQTWHNTLLCLKKNF